MNIWGGTNMTNKTLSCSPLYPTCIPWIQLSHPASSFFHLSGIQTHPWPFLLGEKEWMPLGVLPASGIVVAP